MSQGSASHGFAELSLADVGRGSSGVSLVGSATASGANPSITVPAGTASGDMCFYFTATRNSAPGASGPQGDSSWTQQLLVDTGTTEYNAIYTKTAGASEPATWDWTIPIGSGVESAILVLRGVDSVKRASYISDSISAPSLAGDSKGHVLYVWMGSFDGSTMTIPDSDSVLTSYLSVGTAPNQQIFVRGVDSSYPWPTIAWDANGGSITPYRTASTMILVSG